MKWTRSFAVLAALAVPLALMSSNRADASPILYTLSGSATNPATSPGQLNPGTISGSFTYDPSVPEFFSGSATISGVQSCDLNGNYTLFLGGSDQSDIWLQGVTANNACGQSNTASLLDVHFASWLGTTADPITEIYGILGPSAYFTEPPTVAYAVPTKTAVPEPSSVVLMASALLLLGAAGAIRRRASRQNL